MDGISQGSDMLKYLSGKIAICEEEIDGLKKNINTIILAIPDVWKGRAADSLDNKLQEIKDSVLKVQTNLEESKRLVSAMMFLAQEEEKALLENEVQTDEV